MQLMKVAARPSVQFLTVALMILAMALSVTQHAAAKEPGNQHFQRAWERPDLPVASGQTSRTWMWGPEAFTDPVKEVYEESPDGVRTVQYYDKSRMEISNPDGNPDSDWYVTNGLLVVELTTGKLQAGNDTFMQFPPSKANVAGDPDDPAGPSYQLMGALRNAPALIEGLPAILRLAPDGTITIDPTLLLYKVTAAKRVTAPGLNHIVASPFWLFMNSPGLVYLDGEYAKAPLFPDPFYATGLPITEAYWVKVNVGGVPKDVLVQCFERRCLTYTPGNPEGWQVEAGNVGQHYYQWRYEEIPSLEKPTESNAGSDLSFQ